MASGKKRKIGDEGSVFYKKWTNSYVFVEVSDKTACLFCGKQVVAKKKIKFGASS